MSKKLLPALLLLFAVLIICCPESSLAQSYNQIPDDVEYQALVDLYNSTNGANWTNKTNWLQGTTSSDFANWYGVTVANGDVSNLSLIMNNLVGNIPESIGDLTKLKVLDLRENNLYGSAIPANIVNLINLQHLSLKHCNLKGSIPEDIGNLTSLTGLNFLLNHLEGPIPESVGNLINMVDMRLNHNRLTSIPESLSNLSKLEILYLNNNQLAGPLPGNLGNLKNIKYFNVSANFLSGAIPASIVNLTGASNLLLQHNQFSDTIPLLPNGNVVVNINLSYNKLEGVIPEYICQLKNVRTLNLGVNNLEGEIPECIGSMTGLSYFYANSNKLTGGIPQSILSIPTLRHLKLSANMLTGQIPSSLFSKNIYQITLNDNQLTGPLPEFGNVSIQYLFLQNNNFTGAVPTSIINLSQLIHLRIYGNELTSFPSFTAHPLKTGLKMEVHDNSLGMSSIEYNLTGPGQHPFKFFTYLNQSPPPPQTIAAIQGQPITLTSDDNAPHNHYQWQESINGTWTDIVGATSISYTIAEPAEGDSYRCKLTNDWVTDLTLYSQRFNVTVEGSPTPEAPADLVKNRPTDELGH